MNWVPYSQRGALHTLGPSGASESEKCLVQKVNKAGMSLLFFQKPVCQPGLWPSSGNPVWECYSRPTLTKVAYCASAVCASSKVDAEHWSVFRESGMSVHARQEVPV